MGAVSAVFGRSLSIAPKTNGSRQRTKRIGPVELGYRREFERLARQRGTSLKLGSDIKKLGPISEVSIETLERALSLKPEIWDWNRIKPNRFGCFDGKVEHVVFRYPAALQSHLESIEFPIWRDWKPCIEPLLREAVKDYGYSSGCVVRIMLAKLLPHCQIGAHVDKAPSAEVPHKIHIPIQTSQEAVFICEGRRHHLERGWAYEVNNRVLHGGANGSSRPRIHLIFDYYERTEGLACNLQSL